MYVRIGQIAQALGVSTHLLKHYEKVGLINPIKEEGSNYRYYDSRQCEKIVECKKYRNMGLTLKEIAQMMEGEAHQNTSEFAEKQMEKLDAEQKQLEHMKRVTKKYYDRCVEFDQKYNQWFLELSPAMYFIPVSENGKLLNHPAIQDAEGELIEAVPLCQQMKYRKSDEIVQWGLCIETQDLEELGYPVRDYYLELKAKRSVSFYLKIRAEDELYESIHQQIRHIYREVQDEEFSDSYVIYMKKEYMESEEYHCVKVCISLKAECNTLVLKTNHTD